ncbi:SDR family NAD(P)-dependent oxidoreductase [Nocardioides mangrovicus]|uniref:SDR family NAD(P)-dependent oxidoreductase n=1 Tax=Nocardioides mangrovicus TaxID=2478913 RepID=A0A3L8P6F8_9ACTN|nr:NAD(P)H-binding protein [Nocardioides mangrovicus]RLV50527.1 SDR family NAD(P)-dependent oxidoreductase [Nocardioides mangrovicus]
MSIAVTGASGQLGRLVADRLLETVEPGEVVLLSRDPSKLAEYAERGAVTRRADFDDPASLPGAFAGVEKLLLISTDAVGQRVAGHQAAIDAAVAAGVRHIAYTSIPEPVEANPAAVVPDHHATEEALRASGLAWTMLRNNIYADMQVATVEQAEAAGRLVTNLGDGATAYVTRADCAAVAAAVLSTDGHENQAYDVTGPEAVGAAELAALAGGVEIVQVDDAAYIEGLVGAGLPQPVAELLASFPQSAREGYADHVSDVVERLTGRAPTPLKALL